MREVQGATTSLFLGHGRIPLFLGHHSQIGHHCKVGPARSPINGARGMQIVRHAGDARQIKVLYDGLCRVCLTNKAVLESQDSDGVLSFVNIADDDYEAEEHAGIEYEDAMNELHVILADGSIVRGTEAVFRAYQAVGLD